MANHRKRLERNEQQKVHLKAKEKTKALGNNLKSLDYISLY